MRCILHLQIAVTLPMKPDMARLRRVIESGSWKRIAEANQGVRDESDRKRGRSEEIMRIAIGRWCDEAGLSLHGTRVTLLWWMDEDCSLAMGRVDLSYMPATQV